MNVKVAISESLSKTTTIDVDEDFTEQDLYDAVYEQVILPSDNIIGWYQDELNVELDD